jgi:hypothetical protein
MISTDTIFGCQKLEVSHPLAAIINNRVVTSGEDDIDHVTNYYDILQNIVAYTFGGAKELRVVFFNVMMRFGTMSTTSPGLSREEQWGLL